jgi:hypothetical protein
MTNNTSDKGIPIRTKGRKGVRNSAPVTVHVGSLAANLKVESPPSPIHNTESTDLPSLVIGISNEPSTEKKTAQQSLIQVDSQRIQQIGEIQVGAGDSVQPGNGEKNIEDKGKRKTPPLTMEDFISQAYSRKGQRVGLKPNQEKSLSANHKLDPDAIGRLLDLAKQDRLLQVPRQLLLTARKIQSYPLPKKVLVEFVHAVLKQHPIFKGELLRIVLEEDKQIPSLFSLYQSIKSFSPSFKIQDEHLDQEELEKLRINSLNLMTVWLFYERNVRIDELVAVLLQVIWKPAAANLENDSQLIRALTELDELEAIGWVAERYLKNVVEAQDGEQRAHNEAVNYRSEANSLRLSLDQEIKKSRDLQEQLDALRQVSEETVGALQRTNQETKTHLSYDIEVMRGRLIENLRISIDRLQTGLTALNREVPRIEVMTERAELVIESLQSELKELDGEV